MSEQVHNDTTASPLLPYSLYRGIQARVAKRLKVSKSMVSQVASRKRRSKRIEKALLSEARKIERSIGSRIGKEAA
jgi:DNA-binding transcriptional regulator YdaS (Cro superfamily)